MTDSTALVKTEEGVRDQFLMTKGEFTNNDCGEGGKTNERASGDAGDNNAQDDISLYRGLSHLRRSNMLIYILS